MCAAAAGAGGSFGGALGGYNHCCEIAISHLWRIRTLSSMTSNRAPLIAFLQCAPTHAHPQNAFLF
jgi:hypothetical protein